MADGPARSWCAAYGGCVCGHRLHGADGTRTRADGASGERPVLIVNVSGRGDKDVDTAATWFGMHPEEKNS